MKIERKISNKRMSQIVIAGDSVYLAGQVPSDPVGKGCTEQSWQVLHAIDAMLAEAGTDKSRILTATVYLTDMANFDAFNIAWDEWVAAGSAPARACVEARLARAEWLVEISVIAGR
jgi:enamine deaminase RidA (YjgF/YER057c/UK114 family)